MVTRLLYLGRPTLCCWRSGCVFLQSLTEEPESLSKVKLRVGHEPLFVKISGSTGLLELFNFGKHFMAELHDLKDIHGDS